MLTARMQGIQAVLMQMDRQQGHVIVLRAVAGKVQNLFFNRLDHLSGTTCGLSSITSIKLSIPHSSSCAFIASVMPSV